MRRSWTLIEKILNLAESILTLAVAIGILFLVGACILKVLS